MIIKFAKKWSAIVVGVFAEQWKFFAVFSVCSLILSFFFVSYFLSYDARRKDSIREREIRLQRTKDREAARAEAVRRNAEKSDRSPDPSVRVAPTVRPVRPVLQNRPTREMAEENPGEALSVLEAAKAAERQHALETMAAAKKRRAWELRRDALKKKYLANAKRRIASGDALLASADAELELMLSLFKGMSPEQLEYAREEALKTMPAEKVEAFFDDLANHGTTKTPEQLTKAAQDILKSREARDIIDREIEVESQQIALEEEELKRTEPPIPW
ncbi:hypothetical protein F4054_13285 [Candidatus Poribacteria bacterium]|nr:hypothetical protein [Candidatus Poribacteria bacterium]MYK23217.1 hypothetical protein [Candidatus Poribacteria bacterium]